MSKLKFNEIDLTEEMQRSVSEMGFEEMSPIQEKAIPVVLSGKDIIGQAQTGTGKTAAFGIPILEMVDSKDRSVQALVLCPTRELCIQVAEEMKKLGKFKRGIEVIPVYGGQPIDRQIRALKKGVQIIVGTPGRLIDHIRRKTVKVDNVKFMVLDEADEMFDMGFRDDIALVMDKLHEDRQTIFFSATMPKDIINFASKYQKNPEIIKVTHKELIIPQIEQFYYEVKEHMKTEILSRAIDIYNPKLSIVFCNTKRKVDALNEELSARGYLVDGLHGDLKQNQRDTVMNKFRRGSIDILVATDVAARGLDVDDIDLVINYDIPQDEEYYVHRIGRTARAGREGVAISFVTNRDNNKLRNIQRYANIKIKRKDVPTLKDMEETYTTTMLDKIKEGIEDEDLNKYKKTIDGLIEEGLTSVDIASVLLKFYMGSDKSNKHQELDMVDFGKKSQGSSSKSQSQSHSSRKSGDMKRIHIGIGNRKGVRPRHILAAITQTAGVDKGAIGKIDVYDKFSFVEVDKNEARKVIDSLNNEEIKGTRVRVEIANPRRK
ncbi:DEAD/DEAH box helicase [Tissierella creatinophila]|uniref:ATP-dependent RNA helicase CshA n=1 Tax=Tissierella creatinophila DSM 6911 TaxID=1123403 RepID=A0A1U7M8R0_TISCR|nr:DEAD/DEAH box helicase [Tissierella creatinophila]OLS03724.1 DEAD-box ATP-dependent RNA helicase CshA [Tissierella creatinophila DSM 6911]